MLNTKIVVIIYLYAHKCAGHFTVVAVIFLFYFSRVSVS